MSKNPLSGDRPVLALVAYIPVPLGIFLDELRSSFPAQKGGRAHLTLLSPRPVSISTEATQHLIASAVRPFESFEVELTEVLRFPTTNVIYLGVGHGRDNACRLHEALNTGQLSCDEPFDYRPHVSLVFPPEGANVDSLKQAASAAWDACRFSKHFRVENVDLLQNTQDGEWDRLWNCPLQNSLAQSNI
jgi:2'-5' RNA ligase